MSIGPGGRLNRPFETGRSAEVRRCGRSQGAVTFCFVAVDGREQKAPIAVVQPEFKTILHGRESEIARVDGRLLFSEAVLAVGRFFGRDRKRVADAIDHLANHCGGIDGGRLHHDVHRHQL